LVYVNLVEIKNIKNAINAGSAPTNHVQANCMDAAVDYSRTVGERMR
jgi:hypothetical protein